MDRLEHSILSFIRNGEGERETTGVLRAMSGGHFERLALELFAYQYEKNQPYHAYCHMQGVTPGKINRWHDIPAVPIGAFKSTELATFRVGRAAAIFESSGTAQPVRSRHFLKTLNYYETSLKSSFEKWVMSPLPSSVGGGGKLLFLILAPSPAEAPRSSLTWMLDVVKRAYGVPGSLFLVRRGRLDEEWLSILLAKAETAHEPVALLGTTIALLGFFDDAAHAGKSYSLPRGSRLMDTGGMKTSRREITRPDFVSLAREILGIPEDQCINEYGMCELSSQFYGRGPSSVLEGPPWTRTLVINPKTGHPAPAGHVGVLRHFDLANVDSVMAIQTEDLGIADGDGFIFRGRDLSAEVKGCSLSAEAFMK